jgi:hypothetical protein
MFHHFKGLLEGVQQVGATLGTGASHGSPPHRSNRVTVTRRWFESEAQAARELSATHVDHRSQAPVVDEDIAGNQGHRGSSHRPCSGQRPYDRPDASKPRNIQELFAALEAGRHPRIGGSQLAPRPFPLNALPGVYRLCARRG